MITMKMRAYTAKLNRSAGLASVVAFDALIPGNKPEQCADHWR